MAVKSIARRTVVSRPDAAFTVIRLETTQEWRDRMAAALDAGRAERERQESERNFLALLERW